MDDNQFGENAKEQLEREIEELKRQKEIRDLQRQKEELERTVFGSLGGQAGKQEEVSGQVEEEPEEEEIIEEKYISNKMTTILAAVVAVAIVVIGSGIFYLRSQNKKKRENLKKEMAAVSQNQNIPAVTPQSTQTTEQKPSESANKLPKAEPKKDVNEEVQKSGGKLIVQSPVTVKKGSYCVNPNPAESAFDTDTVVDSYAEHGYMADVSFQDCIVNSGGSVKHTGPVTITVNLAEEKNYDAVMNRSKWYLENGQIRRINGRDSAFLYFNGWLMYKQSN
ncbi:hypothetical protein JMUB3935_1174 [Leptotrichia trevisanii]|uniref:Uncharacterized protein n=1 Tax=Leptotrichia trevisanii TaxID=109328 RepID=A0A510KKL5_9FUSO|nr:hypothetical protein [Leptotrichia trevisanii]BBM52196.1 hypothetical protein JMUB3935_1174 [Leptotrichia trevisanii]